MGHNTVLSLPSPWAAALRQASHAGVACLPGAAAFVSGGQCLTPLVAPPNSENHVGKFSRPTLLNYVAIITFWNLGLAFGMVVLIAAMSSWLGVHRILAIEQFYIFKG